jgi:hypothetical protein
MSVRDSRADIGPRFVARVADETDAKLPKAERWLLAGAFHFAYAAGIDTLAFSPWDAATRLGTESSVETRPCRKTLLHWTAAFSFSVSPAYLQEAPGDTTHRWRRSIASGPARS